MRAHHRQIEARERRLVLPVEGRALPAVDHRPEHVDPGRGALRVRHERFGHQPGEDHRALHHHLVGFHGDKYPLQRRDQR